jgi:para-nitrobenzyl esterase
MHRTSLLAIVVIVGCAGDGSAAAPDAGSADGGAADARAVDAGDAAPSSGTTVPTAQGAVRGREEGPVRAFLGVPYAAPPVGALRFRAPEPPRAFDGVLDATAFGPSCVQHQPGEVVGDEDCLTLNVWTPRSAEGLPVVVFLPAGDNLVGGATEELDGAMLYDGAALAAHDVVVVTLNYRVGALGFLPHPAFAAEASGATGNYGLLDQIAALEWVRQNIAAFGGDPARVVLSGLSAGASDACALIASPRARDLFSRAWMFSGNCDAVMSRELMTSTSTRAAEALGCAGDHAAIAACFRDASVEDLAALPSDEPTADFNPAVDGVVLPDLPSAVIARGDHHAMPMVFSTTAEEYSSLIALAVRSPLVTAEDYDAALLEVFGTAEAVELVRGVYPLSEYPTPRAAMIAIFTDAIFDCPNRTGLRAARAGQSGPVWRAYFRHRFASGPRAARGASHGFDVAFVFHSLGPDATDDERALAGDMAASLATFAATGEPGAIRGVALEPYDVARDNRLGIDLAPAIVDHLRDRQCDFWDENG